MIARRYYAGDVLHVAAYGRRFDAIRPFLPQRGMVGYLSDRMDLESPESGHEEFAEHGVVRLRAAGQLFLSLTLLLLAGFEPLFRGWEPEHVPR